MLVELGLGDVDGGIKIVVGPPGVDCQPWPAILAYAGGLLPAPPLGFVFQEEGHVSPRSEPFNTRTQ